MAFFPLADVRPGMVGTGRTVFAGDAVDEFRAHVLGVLHNVLGPQRDIILARLEGGPLATTGVIQGMSGSPVYVDGKLLGAVAYALGSFPREPIAGITPIDDMLSGISASRDQPAPISTGLRWPADPAAVYAALSRLARQAAPAARVSPDMGVVGPRSLLDVVPSLRPIGAALVMSGVDQAIAGDLSRAMDRSAPARAEANARRPQLGVSRPLQPGEAVGLSLIRGDFEMGASGTVTHVDGTRVYAFGHPFLNLGTSRYTMTRARVFAILPSLDSSMKITTLGDAIGTISQDRSAGVGGMLGSPPAELDVTLTLAGSVAPERRLRFSVLHDQALTPLFSFVAVLNSLVSHERQTGAVTIHATGSAQFGPDTVVLDDVFSGENAVTQAATGLTAALGLAATNEFRPALADRLDLRLTIADGQNWSTIERAWLDTTRPTFGATHTLHVQLRHYRGGRETVSLPVTMPSASTGPVSLLVGDAPAVAGLEQRDLAPGRPTSWATFVRQLNQLPRNNRLYVRLLTASPGTVVGGETLPSLPGTVRAVVDDDRTAQTSPVTKSVAGAWELRLPRAVRGSRELPVVLTRRD
jgi:hypothetical protein